MLRPLAARASLAFVCLLPAWTAPLAAQQAPPATTLPAATPQAPTTAGEPLEAATVQALDHLAGRLAARRTERDAAKARGDLAAAAALDAELQQLGWQFGGLAARLDVREFEAPQQRQFDLQQELEQLVRPLLKTLKDATEQPRQVADLQARIEQLDQRRLAAEAAQRAVERTRDRLPTGAPALAEVQRELDQRWRPALDALRGELHVLRAQLAQKQSEQRSLVDGISGAVQNFVQSSGTSLVLAVGVFLTVFLGLRWLADRLLLRRRRSERGFSLRLIEVVVQVLILLAAIAATLVVPYARNDWLLLAVCIVFLLGAGWVLVKMLPQFFEQIRLVLNVGGVREGERILVDGIPYRVEALRLYTRLANPDLDGGELRVPIQYLIGKRSRRAAADEPWFPCRRGDFVLLADGTFGAVRTQTPEVVVVDHFGAQRSYPTERFLAETPRNLSRGFTVRATVGIDYAHQAEATERIPARLQAALATALAAEVEPGALRRVTVELAAAGASSLDLWLAAEFTGSAAPQFARLERRLQAVFVAACTENGWRIPFPQLTLHRATG
ncbi:MAG: hypothetical protein JNL08_17580 [Planctomycetes bacterium]|nr:hypothetical protein [Planctomycetota bacterium]